MLTDWRQRALYYSRDAISILEQIGLDSSYPPSLLWLLLYIYISISHVHIQLVLFYISQSSLFFSSPAAAGDVDLHYRTLYALTCILHLVLISTLLEHSLPSTLGKVTWSVNWRLISATRTLRHYFMYAYSLYRRIGARHWDMSTSNQDNPDA